LDLRCLLGHKWTPAQGTDDPAPTLVCRRCGKARTLSGSTRSERHNEEAAKAPFEHSPVISALQAIHQSPSPRRAA